MNEVKEKLEGVVRKSPLTLLALRGEESLRILQDILPYSIGIEVECTRKSMYNIELFKKIPDIIEVKSDPWEERFRIPNGIKGLMCLYSICEQLKLNNLLNEGSGIHFHIDMTDVFHKITDTTVSENSEYILTELDKWEYKGTYNYRDCRINSRCWVRFVSRLKTMEIRICDMSFDYSYLINKIIHACQIARKLKENLIGVTESDGILYNSLDIHFDSSKVIEYIEKYLFKVNWIESKPIVPVVEEVEVRPIILSEPQIENIVLNRTIKRF